MIIRTLIVGNLGTNCYLVMDEKTKEGIIIDPGAESGKIMKAVEEIGLLPKAIVLTHGHGDHIGAVGKIKKAFSIPVLIHQRDAVLLNDPLENFLGYFLASGEEAPPPADKFIDEGDKIDFGEQSLSVLYTPGHTPGGISLVGNGLVFTGDTLFAGSVGRTDFPGGSSPLLMRSIREKIMNLDDETIIYPGHGPMSKIEFERRYNPFLQ